MRISSVEEAVAKLRGASPPAETFALLLLSEARGNLANMGIDLPVGNEAYRVSAPVFTKSQRGKLASASFQVSVSRPGEPDLTATVAAEFDVARGAKLVLTSVEPNFANLKDNSITIELDRAVDVEALASRAGLDEIVALGEV